jgi:hypothetical protein
VVLDLSTKWTFKEEGFMCIFSLCYPYIHFEVQAYSMLRVAKVSGKNHSINVKVKRPTTLYTLYIDWCRGHILIIQILTELLRLHVPAVCDNYLFHYRNCGMLNLLSRLLHLSYTCNLQNLPCFIHISVAFYIY